MRQAPSRRLPHRPVAREPTSASRASPKINGSAPNAARIRLSMVRTLVRGRQSRRAARAQACRCGYWGQPPGRFVLGDPDGGSPRSASRVSVSVAELSVALPHHGGDGVSAIEGKAPDSRVVDPVRSVVRLAWEGSDDEGSSGSGCAMSAGRCWCDGARRSCCARPDHVSP